MPIIPRYQPRGGPSVSGLNYAGAYSPPDGSDWRMLAGVAQAAGGVVDMFGQRPQGGPTRGGQSAPEEGGGRRNPHGPSDAKPARTRSNLGAGFGRMLSGIGRAVVAAGSSMGDANALTSLRTSGGALEPEAARRLIDEAYQPIVEGARTPAERVALEANRDSLNRFWVEHGPELQAAWASSDHATLADRTLQIGRQAIGTAPTAAAVDGIAERQMVFNDVILRQGPGDAAAMKSRRLEAAQTLRAEAELRKAQLDPRLYLKSGLENPSDDVGRSTGLLTAQARLAALQAAQAAVDAQEGEIDRGLVAGARSGRLDEAWLREQVAAGALSADRPAVAQAMKIAAGMGEIARQAQAGAALMGQVRRGGGPALDMDRPDHRQALDDDFAAFYREIPAEGRGEAIADYVGAMGVMPPGALDVLDGLLTSDDPDEAAEGAAAWEALLAIDPGLLVGLSPTAMEQTPLEQGDADRTAPAGIDGGGWGEPDDARDHQGAYLFRIASRPPGVPKDQVSPYPRMGRATPLGGNRLPPGPGYHPEIKPDRLSPPTAPYTNKLMTEFGHPPAPYDKFPRAMGDAVELINKLFSTSKMYDLDRLNNYIWYLQDSGYGRAQKIVRLKGADIADKAAEKAQLNNLEVQIFKIPGPGPSSLENLLLSVEYPTNPDNPGANGKVLARVRQTSKGLVTEFWDGTTELENYLQFNHEWRRIPAGMNPKTFNPAPFRAILETYIHYGYLPGAKRVPPKPWD